MICHRNGKTRRSCRRPRACSGSVLHAKLNYLLMHMVRLRRMLRMCIACALVLATGGAAVCALKKQMLEVTSTRCFCVHIVANSGQKCTSSRTWTSAMFAFRSSLSVSLHVKGAGLARGLTTEAALRSIARRARRRQCFWNAPCASR